jgi:peptidoglycan hydrolase CwlO-like protein
MADYVTALEAELKHVEQTLAGAVEKDVEELKARIKDIKAEIKRASGPASKVEADAKKVAADAKDLEKAVAPIAAEVA